MASFTSYWTNRTWEFNRPDEGHPLDHIAANHFKHRGVKLHDAVYVVTIKDGKMYLCARMPVDKL